MVPAMTSLASELLKIGCIRFGSFRLKLHEKNPDAPLSPVYVDLRLLRSFPDAMDVAISAYKRLSQGLHFDCLADVPTAATPMTAVLSHDTRIPMVSPRQDDKSHGTERRIDGAYRPGQTALLVDDLITKADSKLVAIATLVGEGLRVSDVVVLVDREQGGVAQLAQHGCRCHSAFTLRELLSFYHGTGAIVPADYDRTMAYLEDQAR
jgi:orotate phosphoribosyltransferase